MVEKKKTTKKAAKKTTKKAAKKTTKKADSQPLDSRSSFSRSKFRLEILFTYDMMSNT